MTTSEFMSFRNGDNFYLNGSVAGIFGFVRHLSVPTRYMVTGTGVTRSGAPWFTAMSDDPNSGGVDCFYLCYAKQYELVT